MKIVTFKSLTIKDDILKAIGDLGFEEATPIQAQAIPPLLEGRDVIGKAMTGSGKTVAFGIPAIERIKQGVKKVQTLILCPTRELAIQVSGELGKLLKYIESIKEVPIYGGQPIGRQIQALKRGVQIVIGTPGRVIDHLERGTLKLGSVHTVILDEADEMLNMGFREDIEKILSHVPPKRQTVLFSATMSQGILRLAKKYQQDPLTVEVVHEKLTVPPIEQWYYEVQGKERIELLARLIDFHAPSLSIVFCNTKRRVDKVAAELVSRGYFAEGIHGGLTQRKRDKVMKKFREGTAEILVATDVAARGIDVKNVEIVFNYDMPNDIEFYVHRIGRTGRAGKKGKTFSFVQGRELYRIKSIERYTKEPIRPGIAIASRASEPVLSPYTEKLRHVIEKGGLSREALVIERLLSEGYTSTDIAAGLLRLLDTIKPSKQRR